MPLFSFALRGAGRIELPAYGVADAEARTEKEIRTLLPDARVEILEIARTGGAPRIVETFSIAYRVSLVAEAEGEDETSARRRVLQATRGVLEGSRFGQIGWDPPKST